MMARASFFFVTALGVLAPSVAAADGVPLPPWHVGVTPTVGAGVAAMTSGGTFPRLIGLTTFGGEIDASYVRLGVFGRVMFNSSGNAGQWSGWSYTLGPSYRLFGDGYDAVALVARGGVTFERWSAQTGGCSVILFFPNSCSNTPTPMIPGDEVTNGPPSINITSNMLGLMAGVRLEIPVRPIYLALDAEVTGIAGFESGAPGQMIELKTSLVFGFRDRTTGDHTPRRRDPRLPHGSTF